MYRSHIDNNYNSIFLDQDNGDPDILTVLMKLCPLNKLNLNIVNNFGEENLEHLNILSIEECIHLNYYEGIYELFNIIQSININNNIRIYNHNSDNYNESTFYVYKNNNWVIQNKYTTLQDIFENYYNTLVKLYNTNINRLFVDKVIKDIKLKNLKNLLFLKNTIKPINKLNEFFNKIYLVLYNKELHHRNCIICC